MGIRFSQNDKRRPHPLFIVWIYYCTKYRVAQNKPHTVRNNAQHLCNSDLFSSRKKIWIEKQSQLRLPVRLTTVAVVSKKLTFNQSVNQLFSQAFQHKCSPEATQCEQDNKASTALIVALKPAYLW